MDADQEKEVRRGKLLTLLKNAASYGDDAVLEELNPVLRNAGTGIFVEYNSIKQMEGAVSEFNFAQLSASIKTLKVKFPKPKGNKYAEFSRQIDAASHNGIMPNYLDPQSIEPS